MIDFVANIDMAHHCTKAVSRHIFFYSFILGPVIGEVTQSSAVILVEVEFKDAENPTLQCQLFAKVI